MYTFKIESSNINYSHFTPSNTTLITLYKNNFCSYIISDQKTFCDLTSGVLINFNSSFTVNAIFNFSHI